METEHGYEYDISYDPDMKEDVILVDMGDDVVTLTIRDLRNMIGVLDGYQ